MEIPSEGKYVCKLNGPMVVYEASTGSLCAAVPCVVVSPTPGNMSPANGEPDTVGFTFKHTMVLAKADGTILSKTVDTLKAVFGWDGTDPFWLMENSLDEGSMRLVTFEIVGGPETGDKGGQYFKSQWLNPLGGGLKTPAAANRESVMAKYGGKFRALAGVAAPNTSSGLRPPSPQRGEGSKPESGVMPPHSKTPPPVATTRLVAPPTLAPATMEQAWAALNENNPGKPAAVIEKIWFDTIGKLFPNKSNTDLKVHEWGRLKAEFEKDELPM